MREFFRKDGALLVAALGISLVTSDCIGFVRKKTAQKSKTGDLNASAEPDKLLYNRGTENIKHSRYTEGRLSLQTLINTYPDSEYLAKAKLAIADSYFKEGGTSNLTQAIAEYKDFATFFPFLDEASYAQMQVGMAHYRMMDKPDRDRSEALAAEDEFQTFLLKYPQSSLAPQAEQRLRDVQEVLAEGEYRIAHFYYTKQDYPAAAARLVELTDRYPLYSQSARSLWMLADIYNRRKQASKDEDDRNHFADLAQKCYERIITEYPKSPFVGGAKAKLAAAGAPMPQPDPEALARMQKEQEAPRKKRPIYVPPSPMGLLKSGPDVSTAARSGKPNLNPLDESVSATDVLKVGAAGPSFTTNGSQAADGNAAIQAVTPRTTGSVATEGPVVDAATGSEAAAGSGNSAAVEIVTPPKSSSGNPAPNSTAPSALAASAPTAPAGNAPAATTGPTTAADSNQKVSPPSSEKAASQSSDQKESTKESSSKKKKGLRKLIPW